MKYRGRDGAKILAVLALTAGILLYGKWLGLRLRLDILLFIVAFEGFWLLRQKAEPASWLRRSRTAYGFIAVLVMSIALLGQFLYRDRAAWLFAPLLLAALWLGTAITLREERTPGKAVSLPAIVAVASSIMSLAAASYLFMQDGMQYGLRLIGEWGLLALFLPFAVALFVGGIAYGVARRFSRTQVAHNEQISR